MHEEHSDDLIAKLAALPLAQRAERLERLQLTADERAAVERLGQTADVLWITAHGAPPLQEDRTAALLGLVPDPSALLDGKKFSQLRKRSDLKIDEIAQELTLHGWPIATKDVFAWERGKTSSVPPALIQVLSQMLKVRIDQLIGQSEVLGAKQSLLQQLREHPQFGTLVQRWARAKQVPLEMAETMLSSRIVATVHRGETPDIEQNMASLEALVRVVEESDKD